VTTFGAGAFHCFSLAPLCHCVKPIRTIFAVVGSILTGARLRSNVGHVVYTYEPLSSSSITGTGQRTVTFFGWEGDRTWWKVMAAYRRDDLKVTCWLSVHRDQLRAQRSVTSMEKLYLSFTVQTGGLL